MIVKWGLLRVFWRQALPATLVGTLGLGLYCLAWPKVITVRDPLPALVVLAHCLLLAAVLGRFETSAFAFAYSRGCSRDVLWGHVMLAGALSMLAAVLVAGGIVWGGMRSLILDALESPYFPLMARDEFIVPLAWLGMCVLLAPACHYAWIRRAQPTRGGIGGCFTALGPIGAWGTTLVLVPYLHGWFAWLAGALCVVVVLALLLGGRALHRTLEVRA